MSKIYEKNHLFILPANIHQLPSGLSGHDRLESFFDMLPNWRLHRLILVVSILKLWTKLICWEIIRLPYHTFPLPWKTKLNFCEPQQRLICWIRESNWFSPWISNYPPTTRPHYTFYYVRMSKCKIYALGSLRHLLLQAPAGLFLKLFSYLSHSEISFEKWPRPA